MGDKEMLAMAEEQARAPLKEEIRVLRERLGDAEDSMDRMRGEAIMAPKGKHGPAACSQSWKAINEIWSAYQRKHVM